MGTTIHIGRAIEQKMQERGLRVTDFATAIHCNRTNVYSIFSRKNIDIELLLLISKVLEYDFIAELYADYKSSQKYLLIVEADNEKQLQEWLPPTAVKFVKQLS